MLKNRRLRLLLLPIVAYLAIAAALPFYQERVIFPFRGVERGRQLTPPPDAQVWWRDLGEGRRIEAWFFAGRGRSAASPGPAVICFHGNGELIDDNDDVARVFNAWGVSVLLVEYRGYGRSGGATDIAAIRSDGEAWFDRLAARPEVKRDQILAHGFSLGGAFAAQLAAVRPVAGLIVESAFASLPSMVRRQGMVLYFSRERLATDEVLRALPAAVPVLITHGANDPDIPVSQGRLLAAARPAATYVEGPDGHLPLAIMENGHGVLRRFLGRSIPADSTLALTGPDLAH